MSYACDMLKLSGLGPVPVFSLMIALVAGAIGFAACTQACAPTLPPEDVSHVAKHAATLEYCIQLGTGVGPDAAFEVYLACRRDAGIADPPETR